MGYPQQYSYDELALAPRGLPTLHPSLVSVRLLGAGREAAAFFALTRNASASPSHKVLAVCSCGSWGTLCKCHLTKAEQGGAGKEAVSRHMIKIPKELCGVLQFLP